MIPNKKEADQFYSQYAIEGEVQIFKEGNELPSYIYDLNSLSSEQYFDGLMYFKIDQELIDKLPASPDDVTRITERKIQQKAFAAILHVPEYELDKETGKTKRVGFKEYLSVNPPAINALQNIKGIENINLLERIKTDFFYRTGLLQNEWAKQMSNSLEQLSKLSPEDQEKVKDMLLDQNSKKK